MKKLLFATAVLGLAVPAAAQQFTLTLDQMERKYRGMSPGKSLDASRSVLECPVRAGSFGRKRDVHGPQP